MLTPEWLRAIEEWLSSLVVAGRTIATIELRFYQVRRFACGVGGEPGSVTSRRLVAWLAGHAWGSDTMRSHVSALREFFSWAAATGLIEHDPSVGLPCPRATRHAPRPAPGSAVRAGLRQPATRVRAMVALAALQGLRRGEIARVHMKHLVPDLAGTSLWVQGKGGKQRLIPLREDVLALIRAEGQSGWLFPNNQKGGHLSEAHVGKLIRRALPAQWTAHTLRHHFGTVVYSKTKDLLAVQELLGHASPQTTKGYVQVPTPALRAAVESV